MKTLWIARHAEAGLNLDDQKRPLTNHGRLQAQEIGRKWKQIRPAGLHTICSPSTRTLETLHCWDMAPIEQHTSHIEPEFYLGESMILMRHLCGTNDTIHHLCLLAHNPGTSDLIQHVTRRQHNLLPGELAEINLDVESWQEVSEGFGELVRIFKPQPLSL